MNLLNVMRGLRNGWPPRVLAWKMLHGFVNRLAWRYARPSGPEWGIANRIDHDRLLWRLNDWLGPKWSDWWIKDTIARHADPIQARLDRYVAKAP